MSVTSTVVLPAQPTLGNVTLLPLGGNGDDAPRSAYLVSSFRVAGDASVGVATLTITLDTVYQSLVSVVSTASSSATAAAEWIYRIISLNDQGVAVHEVAAQVSHLEVGGVTRGLWSPPPDFEAGQIIVETANVDATEVYFVSATIYNFNKRATERTPLSVLLASLPRASTLI